MSAEDVIWLDNGIVRAGIVPALGGRLLALRLGDAELLHRDGRLLDAALRPTGADDELLGPLDGTFATWRNWGGDKTWPAPQGWESDEQWAGPPDPVLDGGPYAASRVGLDVELSSGVEPRTGLRIHRRIALDPAAARILLDVAVEKVKGRAASWSAWNVTQVPGAAAGADGAGVYVGVDEDVAVTLFAAIGTPVRRRIAPDVVHVPSQHVIGKLGFPRAVGWLAYASDGSVLTQSWAIEPRAAYPDDGSRAEVWMEHPLDEPLVSLGGLWPRHRVVEIEAVGPLRRLATGERAALAITMGCCRCPAPILAVGDAGCVSEELRAEPAGDGSLRVTAVAGVFRRGAARLVWRGLDDRVVARTELGSCGPEAPLEVRRYVDRPEAARTLALHASDVELAWTAL